MSTVPDRQDTAQSLRVTEIFHSIQGESRPAGCPTVFIRLTGCPLRCGYCDTAYAFHGGTRLDIRTILDRVTALGAPYVCVTGGEPLAQPGCLTLLGALSDAGYAVSLETSGAMDIAALDRRVTVVMDIKTPGSGEVARNRWDNLAHLKPEDQVKFVLCDRADFEWARDVLRERALDQVCEVLMSPSWSKLPAGDLADWILADRLPVRLQVQLHKILWGEVRGR